jgi:hypothetical protein
LQWVSSFLAYRQTAGNISPCEFVIHVDNVTDESQADSPTEASVTADVSVPTPADNDSETTSGEGSSEPATVEDEDKVSTEEPEATTAPEEADLSSASQPTDENVPAASPKDSQTPEVMADVAQDEPIVATEDTADLEAANNEPSDEAIIAPIEVVTAESEANDENMATADTMQDISEWEKDDNEASDLDISDWERDDDAASSQAGESETNPSEHQDFEDDSIAQEAAEPTPETEKSTDQQEPEVMKQVQQIDSATSVPPADIAVENDAVPTEITEDQRSMNDTSTALEPEAPEQDDAPQSTPDETQDKEPSTPDTTAEPSKPPVTIAAADAAATDQATTEVETDTPGKDDTGDAKSTTDSQDVIDNVPTPQELDPSISQPDASEENNITDSSTDADAGVHESPADELEPAVNSEAAKDSEQVIVSATPDDVENPDACTGGTYMLCFFCFTSLCRMHFFSLAQLRTFPR